MPSPSPDAAGTRLERFRGYLRDRRQPVTCRRLQIADRLERILEVIADEMEFLPRRHRIEVYGLCADCQRRDLAALRPIGNGS